MNINVYNLDGSIKEELEISDKVFKVEPNENLLHQVLTGFLANKRGTYAHTKDRSEVRGGGKKPWRQKGTGRARHGSIRSPLWVGGGVTFGPTKERSYKVKINKKISKKALAMILSDKIKENDLIVVEKFDLKEPKTNVVFKAVKTLIEKVDKKLKGKGLLVTDGDKNVKLASKNLENIENVKANDLNILDAVNSRYIIIEKESLMALEKRLK